MKTLIIAEAGVNHNGDLVHAKELIAAASESGADLVKFPTFVASNLTSSAETPSFRAIIVDRRRRVA